MEYLSLLVNAFFISVINGARLIGKPVDTAGVLGSSAQLNCSVDDIGTDSLVWKEGAHDDQIYNSCCGIRQPFKGKYEIQQIGGQYNLIIPNVQKEHGVMHKCELINADVKGTAQFTALGVLRFRDETGPARDGHITQLNCEAEYYGTRVPVLDFLDWRNQTITPKVNMTTTKLVRYYVNHTVNAEIDKKVVKCVRYYENNPPEFSDEAKYTMEVRYSVKNVMIHPSPANGEVKVAFGQEINCTASGNPPPKYTWYKKEGNGPKTVQGTKLQVTNDMRGLNRYSCEAYNVVAGMRANMSEEITFRASDSVNSGSNLSGLWLMFTLLATSAITVTRW